MDQNKRTHIKKSMPWGRGASRYRPGLFTKAYLLEHEEACVSDIYQALSREIERLNSERTAIGDKPLRRPNYSSYAKYFHWFKKMRLVKATKRQEPAIYSYLKKRQFYRLTAKGKAAIRAWQDPVRTAHPEFSGHH